MIPPPHQQSLDHGTDEGPWVLSRRTLLRRSVLGMTGIGLVSLLAACGGDDDEDVPAGLDGDGELPATDVPNAPDVEDELPEDDEDGEG
jgi:hypothetical protein